MCLSEQNGLHWGAVKWYYEFVVGYGPDVPEAIIRHVRRCLVCRKQIARLKEAVRGAGGETRGSRSTMKRDVIDTLSLHFGCLEERVTCGRVKPFLPGLLLPSVQVRIPTPITVHIDHCPECAEDLQALRRLGLTAEQLERLEQLYRSDSLDTSPRAGLKTGSAWPKLVRPRLRLAGALRCRRARSGISAFVRGRLEDLDAETLNHLCTCPRCRPHVRRNRQDLLENQTNDAGSPTACAADIPLAQLFDYAVPYGRTANVAQPPWRGRPALVSAEGVPPSDCGQDARDTQGQDALATFVPAAEVPPDHVETCPACLRRIQELDETIYGIAERADSGVATVYRTAEDNAPPQSIIPMRDGGTSENHLAGVKAGPAAGQPIDLYPDYPIRVQVLRDQPQSAVAVAAWKRAAFDPRVRFLLKTAVAAAAMIPLTFLFLNTSPASGTTLAQVVKAFEKAPNIHVTSFYPNTGQITQELWVSRATNHVFMTVGREHALYDLAKKKKLANSDVVGSRVLTDLSDHQCAEVRRALDACLGFTLGDVPNGSKWTRLDDDSAQGVEAWELSFAERDHSEIAFLRRIAISIDPVTRLPSEVRSFRKRPAESEWHCLLRTECQYLTDAEMATSVQSSIASR